MKRRLRLRLWVAALALLAAGIAALSSFTVSAAVGARGNVLYCAPLHPNVCFDRPAVLEFQPASVNFPTQLVGTTSAPRAVTLVNISGGPIMVLSGMMVTGDFSTSTNCPGMPATIPVGGSCTIQVAFTPQGTGARTGSLRVAEGATDFGYYFLALSGSGAPIPSATLDAVPRSLDFPPQRVSTASEAWLVTIFNMGTGPLHLLRISASGDFAIVPACGDTLPPGGTCAVNVWFTPSAGGARTGSLRIESDAATNPVVEVALSGRGSAAAANATALWGNTEEPGWGINFNQQDNRIFASLFTYGTDGTPLWLFASGLEIQPDGSFTGDLFRATSGPPFDRLPWTPITVLREGSMTLRFNDDGSATLTYSVGAVVVVKSLRPHAFGNEVPNCSPGPVSRAAQTNYQDLWWNPAESGWGLNLAHQGNILFASLFTYADDGRNAWFFASALARQPDGSFSGSLYSSTGPSFASVPWGPISVREVGTMALRFSNGETGSLTYVVNGRTVTKAITRYVFGNTAPDCK